MLKPSLRRKDKFSMTIRNRTKHTNLTKNAIEAKSLMDQTLGLLKYKTPTAMLIKTRFGIHTFFMKNPIDVIVLDKQNRVVKIKENLKPNQLFFWNPKYETIVELPVSVIEESQTQIGNKVTILL